MRGRLIFLIISTILEEAALVVVVLWGLPQLGVLIPLWGLIIIMLVWAAYSIFTYRLGTRALMREQMVGLPDMIGCRGEVISPLAPEGMVRIKGELWIARSDSGEMKEGIEVIVVGQDRLELIVQESEGTDTLEK